jgi:hypothetical protein
MNPRTLLAAALAFLAVGGCGSPELPPGLTQQEAQSLGVTQGVAGRFAVRAGSCEPGCALCDVDVEAPRAELWALPTQEETRPALSAPERQPSRARG